MLCKYRDIFGKVNTGLHAYRLFNIAIVDVLLTILLGFIIKYVFPSVNIWYVLIGLFLLAIIIHRIFCVQTTINKLLF